MRPRASIVIATRNRAPQLEATLESIEAQGYENIEVVVVDDGSTDATNEVLRTRPWVKVEQVLQAGRYKPNPGGLYNLGHQIAKGKIVIEQNAELFHVNDCVSPLLKACKRHRAAFATVWNGEVSDALTLRDSLAIGEYAPELEEIDHTYTGRPQWKSFAGRVPRLWTGPGGPVLGLYCGSRRPVPLFFLGAIHSKDFNEIGGYNEKLAKHADGDLAHRLCNAGVSWRFLTSAVGVHLRHPKR